ncbi:eCIS core domain-containing protein [Flavobacterium hercynium]|uniref:eCIS core domain-containing protein n=1 Tax=Flavobacterium hercynium TaxID=387094 RepID=A0A226HQG8_9FLAO|nr:DUF4157 domain-containing protein [Flavobacterium hercynium]OXA95876.1 hypothetical protein B0A66_01895 [Flavobacterium hercynium]SMP34152.1 protein of unknown function [Flavobacterium hercynium]
MNSYANQLQENKNIKTAAVTQKKSHHKVSYYPANVAQMQLQEIANNSVQVKQALQLRAIANSYFAFPIQKKGVEEELQMKVDPVQKKGAEEEELQMKAAPIQRKGIEEEEAVQGKFALPIQKKANNTGLPDNLKSGIENLSGFAMDDVKVHYNSAKPAQIQAHAYAQGTDIHVASGQEKHLPHEAWHVVQQKQGRVQPTMQMKGNINVNDDAGLENEADVMGEKAMQQSTSQIQLKEIDNNNTIIQQYSNTSKTIQRNADEDLLAGQQNQTYFVNESANLNTAGTNVYNVINGAPNNSTRDKAAAGYRYYWQTMLDGFDGKKAEMYEAKLLSEDHTPILSNNDFVDPDVRIETVDGVEATEVKTINSDNTGNVNTLIKGADMQLSKRDAYRKKIKIRIESANNLWPDARYNNTEYIKSNTDLKNWLSKEGVIPKIPNTNSIDIEGINIPYESMGDKRNFSADIKRDGIIKKTGAQVWVI